MWKKTSKNMEIFEAKERAFQILLIIIKTVSDPKIKIKALTAFGTILYFDSRIVIPDLEDISVLIDDPDPEISLCANVIEQLNSITH